MIRASSTGVSPCTLWPASSTCTTAAAGQRGAAARPRRSSSTTDCGRIPRTSSSGTVSPAMTSHRSRAVGDPPLAVAGVRADLAVAGVAPHPRAVLALLGVVQDAPAQRRLRARRVVLHRPRQQVVEAGERRRPVDEVGDRLGLLRRHAGRDVDEHHRRARARAPGGRARSSSCRRATCRRRPWRRAPAPGSPRRRRRRCRPGRAEPSRPPSEWPWPGRSMATSGRPRASATVSHVWAFWAPPWRNTSSGGPVAPHRARSAGGRRRRRRTRGAPSAARRRAGRTRRRCRRTARTRRTATRSTAMPLQSPSWRATPPSTRRHVPVIHADASLAKNSAAPGKSSA